MPDMREIHGIAGVRKVTASNAPNDRQDVGVIDAAGMVRLTLSACSYPADLTPDEARWLAKQLVASARRAVVVPAA